LAAAAQDGAAAYPAYKIRFRLRRGSLQSCFRSNAELCFCETSDRQAGPLESEGEAVIRAELARLVPTDADPDTAMSESAADNDAAAGPRSQKRPRGAPSASG